MIDKEIRTASWKFGLIALVVLIALTQTPTPYEEIVEMTNIEREFLEEEIPQMVEEEGLSEREARDMYGSPPDPVEWSLEELSRAYVDNGVAAMVILAGLLGAGLVSSEVGGGTIFALLSRPISRTRLFLTKYIVCAAFLLAATALGTVALFSLARLRDYPLGEINFAGLALAAALLWLVSLFVLGMALLVSTLLRNALQSLIGTAVVIFLIITFPNLIITFADIFLWNDLYYDGGGVRLRSLYRIVETLSLGNYWLDASYFWPDGPRYLIDPYYPAGGLKVVDFIVCFFAAAIPLFAALWLFNRKKF